MKAPMRRLVAMLLLLGIVPVLLFGFSDECPGEPCRAENCCLAACGEGQGTASYADSHGGDATCSHVKHRHGKFPLLRDDGERRAMSLSPLRALVSLPGGGVRALCLSLPGDGGILRYCKRTERKEPMWMPLRC